MNCSQCGAPLIPGAMSCPKCGLQFSQPVPGFLPPVYDPNSQKKSKFPAWACALSGCGCAFLIVPILAAILFPVFAKAREHARQITCETNERQLGLGLLQYTQDFDGKLPPANTWVDATYPYLKFNLHCPDVDNGVGYAYNSNLNSVKIISLKDPTSVLAAYDSTNTYKNATDPLTSIPSPGRHTNGNNYLFADGHVIWSQTPPGT